MSKKKLKKKVRELKERLSFSRECVQMWICLGAEYYGKAQRSCAPSNDWRPISERPEVEQEVWVWHKEVGKATTMWLNWADYIHPDFTHWMPLPAGPNQSSDASAERSLESEGV